MKKKLFLALIVVVISIIPFGAVEALAGSYEDLTYSVSTGEVTITGCDDSMIVGMIIPSTMEGHPVTSIGDSVFEDCRELESITIPGGVTSIGDYAFRYCNSLDNVYYEGTEEEWKVITIGSGNEALTNATIHYNHNQVLEYLTYTITNGEVAITSCVNSARGELIIPQTIDGCPVTIIGDKAFQSCSRLTSITIPDSVTIIGDKAFFDCWALKIITIPDGITSIGDGAFYDCSSLTSITIPDGVTSISSDAFSGCSSLTSITIPDGVTSIDDEAFYGCSSLTCITIPDSIISIGDFALFDCSGLKSIIIPDSVISIGIYAFSGCLDLESITIPNSITNICDSVFYFCSSLTDVYYKGTEKEWEAIFIGPYNKDLTNATIHFVPNTKTTISNNGRSFTITPINVENGKTVILALYNGDEFVEMQSAVYTGEEVSFTTTKEYTKAKVMVWDYLTNLKPVCEVENVK